MEIQYHYYYDYYIVGHGLGAMVACHLALIDAPKVRGLILLNPLRPDGYQCNLKIKTEQDVEKLKYTSDLKTMINQKNKDDYQKWIEEWKMP